MSDKLLNDFLNNLNSSLLDSLKKALNSQQLTIENESEILNLISLAIDKDKLREIFTNQSNFKEKKQFKMGNFLTSLTKSRPRVPRSKGNASFDDTGSDAEFFTPPTSAHPRDQSLMEDGKTTNFFRNNP